MIHALGRGLGLSTEVKDVTRQAIMPDAAADLMTDGMLAVLLDGADTGGVAFVDAGPLTAIIEQQTRGGLGRRAVSRRAPTATDAALAADVIDRILGTYDMMAAELDLDGTVAGYRFATPIAQQREVILALKDAPHEHWRIDVSFPTSDARAGSLHIVLPMPELPELADHSPTTGWSDRMQRRVMGSEIVLQAQLGTLTLTADALRGLKADQVLKLPRLQIGQVKLKGPGGVVVGQGRLGQSAGRKALRIEAASPEAFSETGETPTAREDAS